MNFSEAVKATLSKTGMKRAELARKTGYSYQHIHDLLSGDRRWNEDSINKVCLALDLRIEIVSEEDKPNGEPISSIERSEHHYSRDQQLQADCESVDIRDWEAAETR